MTEAASVYGEALYALAKDENKSDEMLSQLKALDEAFVSEPAFLRLLSAPNVSKIERKEILDTCFRGKVEPYLLNFLKILMEKGYIRQFSNCVQYFRERYNEEHGIMQVSAVTAVPMSEGLQDKLLQIYMTMTYTPGEMKGEDGTPPEALCAILQSAGLAARVMA